MFCFRTKPEENDFIHPPCFFRLLLDLAEPNNVNGYGIRDPKAIPGQENLLTPFQNARMACDALRFVAKLTEPKKT